MQLQRHLELSRGKHTDIAPFAEDTSIDLLVPSYHHKCHICSIVLAKYTRVVVKVNEPDVQEQRERYRNYCVSCLSQHIRQIAGSSLVLDYYVCPKITRKEQKLQNWSIGQISELFECTTRFGESSTKQIHKQFTKITHEHRLQKQLEMEYRGIYSQYFKNSHFDHINRQKIEYIVPEQSVDDCPVLVQDYPLQDQSSVQSFLNLNKSDNYTQFSNGSSDKSYLCKEILMSEQIRKIGSTTKLKQLLDEDSEYLIKLLSDELTKSQLEEKDFNIANKQLCNNFVVMQKRKSRAGRQSIEEKSQEYQFNIQHPELSKFKKISNLAIAFDEIVMLKQQRENILTQRQKQNTIQNSNSNSFSHSNSRGDSIVHDQNQMNIIQPSNSRQHEKQSSSSHKKEKESSKGKKRSTRLKH